MLLSTLRQPNAHALDWKCKTIIPVTFAGTLAAVPLPKMGFSESGEEPVVQL